METFQPSPHLKFYIDCFWILETDRPESIEHRVIPDGSQQLFIHYGTPLMTKNSIQQQSFLNGQNTSYLDVKSAGITRFISINFKPWGLAPFIKAPVFELTNHEADLTSVLGSSGRDLEEKVLVASSTKERIAILETYLMNRLSLSHQPLYKMIANRAESIYTAKHTNAETALYSDIGMCSKTFEKYFKSVIGIKSTEFKKICRLNRAVKLMRTDIKFTELAHLTGYFDQSHLIKDFKNLTGLTPKQFRSASCTKI